MTVTSIYRGVMLEIERRRMELGVPMEIVDEMAGTQDRYYAKCVHADAKSGRQTTWQTLDWYLGALFPDGFDVVIRAAPGNELTADSFKRKLAASGCISTGKGIRRYMAEIGGKGGKARLVKISPAKRRAIARKAGKANGARRRALRQAALKRLANSSFDDEELLATNDRRGKPSRTGPSRQSRQITPRKSPS